MNASAGDRGRRRFTALTARDLAAILTLTAVYAGAGKFGLSLAIINPSASAVWPPTGIALAALLLFGLRLWPAIFAGAFLVNLMTHGTVWTSLAIGAGNTLEAVAGTWLVSKFANGVKAFETGGGVLRFLFFAALCSTTLSPSIGLTSLCLGGF